MEKKKEKITTLDELAVMINNGFQDTQDHFNKRFQEVDKKFEILTGEMNKNFQEVKKQINTINLNIVDVVHKDEFDELESRVVSLENASPLSAKKS